MYLCTSTQVRCQAKISRHLNPKTRDLQAFKAYFPKKIQNTGVYCYNVVIILPSERRASVFIKRELETTINSYLKRKSPHCNVLLLSGARQVGKSTLVANVIKREPAIVLNLFESPTLSAQIDATDTFEEFERLLLRTANFKPSNGSILVIDEAQESKRIGRWLRFFKEKWTNQKAIVLGSILSNLFEGDATYPVGHVEEIVLRPFTFKEFLSANKREGLIEILQSSSFERPLSDADRNSFIKPYLDYLRTGGMPEIVVNNVEGSEGVHAAWDRLLRHYALDVERHMGEMYKSIFISAADRIADITCSPVKMSQIISTQSPSYRRLPGLMEILEKWHLVHRVQAQTKHPESASGLASKRYLFDVGFVNFFINQGQTVRWDDRGIKGNIVYPKLQESLVCNEIVAYQAAPSSALNYYKESRNSQEIDFIVTNGDTIIPIEVKSQSSFGKNSLIPMINYLSQRNLKTGILIYNGEMKSVEIGNITIHAVPPYYVSEFKRLIPALNTHPSQYLP